MGKLTLIAVIFVVACTNASEPTVGAPLAPAEVDTPDPFRLPAPPSEEAICEIVLYGSSREDIENTLGTTTDLLAAQASVTLGYDFQGGLKLLLTVDQGVFASAMVYGGDYPECWTDEQKMHDDAIRQAAQMQWDGGSQ